ncbi:helix-turn-helix domain-containing protein [Coraliomargarita algicola]|uniref:helix-turn-helix domain-containing protein n=1 Tax=Coraliomargarita algicola TaxID=3092156 RepID=UPI003CE483AA
MRASAYIKENQRIERIGQLLAKALVLSSCAPPELVATQVEDCSSQTAPILTLFDQHKVLGMSEIMDLADMSRTTAHRRLRELVKAGKLIPQGKGRATRYHLPKPLITKKS